MDLVGPRGFVKEPVAAFAEAGATTLILHPLTTDPDEYLPQLEHHTDRAQVGRPALTWVDVGQRRRISESTHGGGLPKLGNRKPGIANRPG
jgi:hypothetical protein